MSQPQDPRDEGGLTRKNQDPAEGSRENVNISEEGGVSNRPIEEEQREQQELPPRGGRKDGAHA